MQSHSSHNTLRLLVAIPCLNEGITISTVIKEIPKNLESIHSIDILVIDDGSTDDTAKLAANAGAVVIKHSHNKGVGAAFQTAVNYALENKYDLMVNMDGDRQFNPQDIAKLVAPILLEQADMVTASRFIDPAYTPQMPVVKLYGNHMMSFLISRLVRHKFADVSCGFRCYSRESLLKMNLHGTFTYTQETFLAFAAKGLVIKETPVQVIYYQDRKSRIANSIFKYAINTSKIIFRGYRDYYPLRFFWGISLLFIIPAIILLIIFFGNYWLTGRFSGFLFAGFSSAFLIGISVIFFVLGIVTDMLDRIRTNQERILFLLKKKL